jgi:hypothetical protein
MIFQDEASKALTIRLNKNPSGVTFVIGQFIQQSQSTFDFVENPSANVRIVSDYVPGMWSTIDTAKGIPNRDLYEWTWTLTVALSGEDENLSPQKEQRQALDFFRQDLINNPTFEVTVDKIKYRAVTMANNITSVSETVILKEDKRTIVSMTIPMQSGINAFFGNDLKVSLSEDGTNFSVLQKVSSSHKMNKVSSSGFPLTGDTTLSVAKDSVYAYNTVVLYDDNAVMNQIVSDILIGGSGSLNRTYTQKIEFATIGTIPNKKVLLTGGSIDDNNGAFITVGFDITVKPN